MKKPRHDQFKLWIKTQSFSFQEPLILPFSSPLPFPFPLSPSYLLIFLSFFFIAIGTQMFLNTALKTFSAFVTPVLAYKAGRDTLAVSKLFNCLFWLIRYKHDGDTSEWWRVFDWLMCFALIGNLRPEGSSEGGSWRKLIWFLLFLLLFFLFPLSPSLPRVGGGGGGWSG